MSVAQPLSNRTYLETPENVRLAFRLAGPGTRLGAYAVDLVLRLAVFYALTWFLVVLEPLTGSDLSAGAMFLLLFVLEWGYGALFETWWNGQTPGKRILGLRVIKTEGYAIGFYDAVLRNLLRAADFAPVFYAAGFLTMLSTSRFQRIGDVVAGTMVIREKREELIADLTSLTDYSPFPVTSFEHDYRPAEKTLEAIEMLFHRRMELAPERMDEIALVLAEPVAQRLASPADRQAALERPSEFLFRVLRSARERDEARAA